MSDSSIYVEIYLTDDDVYQVKVINDPENTFDDFETENEQEAKDEAEAMSDYFDGVKIVQS